MGVILILLSALSLTLISLSGFFNRDNKEEKPI